MINNKNYALILLTLSLIGGLAGCGSIDRAAVVSFETYGGSLVEEIIVEKNNFIDEPFSEKTGYSLEGWYTTSELSTKWSFLSDKVTQDMTLHAKWSTNSYTITFVTNGGSSVNQLTRLYGSVLTLPTPTKTGNLFDGWFTTNSLTTLFTSGTMPAFDLILYAKWSVITTIDVSSLSFQNNKVGLSVGKTITLVLNIIPSNATNKTITWSSSNTGIATVSSTGLVTTKAIGKATITARSHNLISTTATLSVFYAVGDREISEIEPNNTLGTADNISQNGTTVYGRNSSKSDIDYFRVYLTSGDRFNLVFASNYTIDAQYYLIGLQNAAGTTLTAIFGTQAMTYLVSFSGYYYIGVIYSSSSPWSNGDLYAMYVTWY
jgi:uncharacterized repeat protein (TIGR02543 family)